MFLSLSLTLPVTTFDFGIVGMMKMDLGTETVNGVQQPVSVTALVQMFVDVGPLGVGLGFTTAICRTPWEIIPNIYLLFPMKLKVIIDLEDGIPDEIAFAGGFQLGSDPSTARVTYAQVMVDYETQEYSLYLDTEHLGFVSLIENIAQIKVPAVFENLLSIESATISYNPSASAGAATITQPPATSSLVATTSNSGMCDNPFSLLTFAPLPEGVSIKYLKNRDIKTKRKEII